jgi:pyrroline-5-carboxylate reductase
MVEGKKIGFVGSGNMAEALIRGLVLPQGHVPADDIVAADVREQRLEELHARYGIQTTLANPDVINAADVVILAVKPQIVQAVLREIDEYVDASKLVISMAAGVKIDMLQEHLPPVTRVIRTMPNVAALVHAAMTGVSRGAHATDYDVQIAQEIFQAVGETVFLEEKYMDAVTGLSGSGPGYVFAMINALSDGGVKVGLPRDVATRLAAQTLYGAAKMLLETGEHPMKLRDMVTSPGGTTIMGLTALEQGGLNATLINMVEAATKRSQELGQK